MQLRRSIEKNLTAAEIYSEFLFRDLAEVYTLKPNNLTLSGMSPVGNRDLIWSMTRFCNSIGWGIGWRWMDSAPDSWLEGGTLMGSFEMLPSRDDEGFCIAFCGPTHIIHQRPSISFDAIRILQSRTKKQAIPLGIKQCSWSFQCRWEKRIGHLVTRRGSAS